MTRQSPQSQVALIAALIVALVGVGLVVVLAVGLLDGVRGVGPLLLAALAIGVFALAGRLYLVAKPLRSGSNPAQPSPRKQSSERDRPRRPRPRTGPRPGNGVR